MNSASQQPRDAAITGILTRPPVFYLAGLFLGLALPPGKFAAALTIGSGPTAFAFAAIGGGWADQPMLALLVSYVLPIMLPIALYLMRLRAS